jgi:cysteine synthase A
MSRERHPVPTWVVVGAGTGGTSATIGRFVRYRGLASRVCVVDPERSAFLPAFRGDDAGVADACGSRIEGIGRPRVEPSFVPTVVDRMLLVPDAASVAAMRFLTERTGLRAGASTGTNLYGALRLACELAEDGGEGSIVSLLCDGADRYAATYSSDAWLAERGLDLAPHTEVLARAWDEGRWTGGTSPAD